MGHPAEGQQRVRGGHGRRAGRVHAAARSRYSAGLPGRDQKQLIAETRAPIQMKEGRPQVRLRIRAQRHGQSLHDVRAARRLAACQSHGSPHRRGLCSRLEGFSRYPLLERQENCSGARQSQHPHQGFSLRSFSRHRSKAVGRTVRMALHSKAWQLARHGGVRTRDPLVPMHQSTHPDKQTLIDEIAAWEDDRNANHANADWQFTTADARIKLKHLLIYPSI